VKVYVGRSPADGRKRYVERTVQGSKREAERELARLVVEVDDGRHVAAGPVTFGDLLDRWLDVKRLSVEPTTLRLSTGQEELMRDAWEHLVEVEGTVSGDPETNAPLAVRRVTDVRLFFDDPLPDRWLSARGAARSPDSRPV
jgi:hypothetical protein